MPLFPIWIVDASVTSYPGTKLGKNLGGAKQRQLERKEVQQILAPPTCTSTAKILDDGSMGLRLLASGRGGWSPPSPTAGSVPVRIQHEQIGRDMHDVEEEAQVQYLKPGVGGVAVLAVAPAHVEVALYLHGY